MDSLDQAALDKVLLQGRRHRQQGEARRQRHPRCLPRRRPRRRRRLRSAALALPRRRPGARPADAADEHPQRRPARRQRARDPGVHDRPPPGRPPSTRRSVCGAGDLRRPQAGAEGQGGSPPRSATRAASLRTSGRTRRRSGSSAAPSRRPATSRARTSHLALDCAASEFFDKKSGTYTFDKKKVSAAELVDIYEKLVATFPIVSIEGRLRRGRLGRVEERHRQAGQEGPARGRRSLRHQRRASSVAASRAASATPSS